MPTKCTQKFVKHCCSEALFSFLTIGRAGWKLGDSGSTAQEQQPRLADMGIDGRRSLARWIRGKQHDVAQCEVRIDEARRHNGSVGAVGC